jgi:ketosteroid isomerase-like protein
VSQEHVEAVRQNLDAWNRGDVDGWLASSHPQVEWISEIARRVEGSELVYRGHEGLRRYWDEWHSVWEVTVELEETVDLGDTVLALGRVRAHGEASGVDLDTPIAFVFEFEEGLARRARAYLDQQEALDAVGHSKRVP